MADNQSDSTQTDDTQDDIQQQQLQQQNTPPAGVDAATLAKLVSEQVESALKPIKDKLDTAYKARDEAQAKVKEFERKEREETVRRLQEEGKHKEAAELAVSEEKAKREAAERKVVELTRDLELKSVLGALNFRNEAATEMARRDIVTQLVQNDDGAWVHRSGASIADFAKTFSENTDNSFLFKPKVSSGGGSSTTTKTVTQTDGKSLFDLSQEEVLKRAANGGVRRKR